MNARLGSGRRRRPRRGLAASALIAVIATLVAVPLPADAKPPPGVPAAAAAEDFRQWEDASSLTDYNPWLYEGSMVRVAQRVGATTAWAQGYTGRGVDVALIDSGVVPVDGLRAPGKVINGPDLSFDSQSGALRYLDAFGHGTHLAGIIAGRDDGVAAATVAQAGEHFVGIAPDARIVNVKVADASGAVDVSQVIAAVDWVVQHRNDPGMNIRVLTLAFGTDGGRDYLTDPLAFALEQAWKAGIVVVVAAGNDGSGAALRSSAVDPFVIAIGASQGQKIGKDAVAPFTSCGSDDRHVDLLAPGRSIVSLRNPGSRADTGHPEAVVAERLFLGSGTSQAAAVASGAVALLLEQRPELTPDQVKALLMETAEGSKHLDPRCSGAGEVDLHSALWEDPTHGTQQFPWSSGDGSLEASRGSVHVSDEGVVLEGEQDIFGSPWDGASWSAASAAGVSWSGGDWNGSTWTGSSWSGSSWSSILWSGVSWSGASWSSDEWSGASWSGASWSGASWSSALWSGVSWSGDAWLGLSWK